MSLRILLVLLCASLAGSAEAQTRKYSNEFLSLGVGARAIGMAGTQVSLIDDHSASYWNPAGLLGIQSDLQVGVMHSEHFGGIAAYDYAGFGKKLDERSAIGFSFIRFAVDDIPNTTQLIDANGVIDYDRITRFSAADYAFLFSYARIVKDDLHLGGNVKVIHRVIGDFAKAWGFGLDAGAQYQTGHWKLGAMLRDATTTVNAWSFSLDEETRNTFIATGNVIPESSTETTLPLLVIGGSRQFDFNEQFSITAAMDFDISSDGQRNTIISSSALSIDPHMGLEASFNKLIYLRAGLGGIQEVTNIDGDKETIMRPNIGLGIKLKSLSIDYAQAGFGNSEYLLSSNVFSIRLDIFKPET